MRYSWECNIMKNLKETECESMDWIFLALDMVKDG
jgi:hypothetical protein